MGEELFLVQWACERGWSDGLIADDYDEAVRIQQRLEEEDCITRLVEIPPTREERWVLA